jgi:lysophospholipase L1-like esterase
MWIISIGSIVVVALAVGEGVFRSLLNTQYNVWPPGFQMSFNPAATTLPGVTGPSRFLINKDGFRGDPLPKASSYKILTVGGSTTECLYLDETKAWPYLLQQTLRRNGPVWVGNVGKSGLNSKHHLIQVEHLTRQYPGIDAIILLIGANDFLQRLSRGIHYQPFMGVESMPRSEYEILMSEAFFTWPGADNREPFVKRLALYRVVREWKYRYLRLPAKQFVQDVDASVYNVWRAHRHSARAIIDDLPDLSSALDEYSRNISAIKKIAVNRGVRLIFATQPYLWRKDLQPHESSLLWLGGVGKFQEEPGHEYYSASVLADGMNMYNQKLLQLCRDHALECVDLEKELLKDTRTFYDDAHFTETGAQQVAGVFAGYLLSKAPFLKQI